MSTREDTKRGGLVLTRRPGEGIAVTLPSGRTAEIMIDEVNGSKVRVYLRFPPSYGLSRINRAGVAS